MVDEPLPHEMTAPPPEVGSDDVPPEDVPPEVAERIVRAIDRSPDAVVTLVNADLTIAWVSHSATWVTGTDPSGRKGADSLERIHPDDVERLMHGLAQLQAAKPGDAPTVPVIEPLRYRFQRFDGRWVVMEATIHNLLDDPVMKGMLVESRPVDGGLDGVGHVVDLLVAEAPLPEVLEACARVVPEYLGSTAVIALLDDGPVIGGPADSPALRLAADDRWWRKALAEGDVLAPVDFAGFPRDLADQGRAEGFRSAWVLPLAEASSTDVIGCVAIWVQIGTELNIALDQTLRQTRRLSALVIGEERHRNELRRQAVTDPLTGLKNRAALRRRLDTATGPVTLAAIDLDDFKPINDTHGHDTGDAVLQVVAERLRDAVRADDLLVRFGGDEFAVVFAHGTSPDRAADLAQRIADAIDAPMTLDGGLTVTVSASIGLATATADTVVSDADTALYESKRNRRGMG
jgi:diguanylate cyclase (GGDEF)-like protein